MKKKVKKFAKGGFGGAMGMGGMGGMGRGSSLPNSSGMGKLSNMSPRKIADLRSAAQQAGNIPPRPIEFGTNPISLANLTRTRDMMGGAAGLGSVRNTGNIPPRPIQAGNIPPRPIQAGFGPISSVNSTTTQDMMGGDRGLGSVRNLGNLPSLVNARDTFAQYARATGQVFKKGGAVKASKSVSSASKRADGIATKGKTRGKMV